MSAPQHDPAGPSERRSAPWAAAALLGCLCAAPAGAEDPAPPKAANWTVFLTTGSSLAAREVHHDLNQGRYTIRLPNGGTIMLSDTAVRRVSRETTDRVEAAEPVVAASTGSPRPGLAPGSIDTTGVRPVPLRQTAVQVDGEAFKARSKDRGPASAIPADARTLRRPSEEQMTPKRGQMERMVRRANTRVTPPRR